MSNEHYELCAVNAHRSYSLRDPSQYVEYANSNSPTGRVTYDEANDGARIYIPEGSDKLGTMDYLILPFDPLCKTVDQEASFQWEARWGSSYLGCKADGLDAHKAFRITYVYPGVDARRLELQSRYSGEADPSGTICLPTIRTYRMPTYSGESNNPLSFNGDEQPGGDPNLFHIMPDVWVRFTISVTWHDGEQRIRMWIADENRDPVLVLADPVDPSKGFLADNPDALLMGFSHFYVLFDTSQDRVNATPLEAWARNVLIYKNSTVPLGGRPIAGPGTPVVEEPPVEEPPVEEPPVEEPPVEEPPVEEPPVEEPPVEEPPVEEPPVEEPPVEEPPVEEEKITLNINVPVTITGDLAVQIKQAIVDAVMSQDSFTVN